MEAIIIREADSKEERRHQTNVHPNLAILLENPSYHWMSPLATILNAPFPYNFIQWREVVGTVLIVCIALVCGGWICKLIGGYYFYLREWFKSGWGYDDLVEPCARISKEEGRGAWGRLSLSEWFLLQKCLGNRDGFVVQGHIWPTLWELLKGWVKWMDTNPYIIIPVITISMIYITNSNFPHRVASWIHSLHLTVLIYIEHSWTIRAIISGVLTYTLYRSFWDLAILVCVSTVIVGIFWSPNLVSLIPQTIDNILIPRASPIKAWVIMREFLPRLNLKLPLNPRRRNRSQPDDPEAFHDSKTNERLQDELLQERKLEEHLRHELEMKHYQLEHPRNIFDDCERYKQEAQRCCPYHSNQIGTQRQAVWPDEQVLNRIRSLETQVEGMATQHNMTNAAYEAKIDKLQGQLKYSQTNTEDLEIARKNLRNAETLLYTSEEELILLRGQAMKLEQEKQFQMDKCHNEAICQATIKDLKGKNASLLGTHRTYDETVRQVAIQAGVKETDARRLNLTDLLREMTAWIAMLNKEGELGTTRGLMHQTDTTTPNSNAFIQKAISDHQRNYQERLENEVERLGGIAKEVELGLDTTRPKHTTTKKMTYEDNAARVYDFYTILCDTVVSLEFLYTQYDSKLPDWPLPPPRNDWKYLDGLYKREFKYFVPGLEGGVEVTNPSRSCPPTTDLLDGRFVQRASNYPTYDQEDILFEKLVIDEVQTLYNRCVQLISELTGLTHTGILGDEIIAHVRITISQAELVLQRVLRQVLDFIPSLCHPDKDFTERSPDPRIYRQLEIYNGMQIAISEMSREFVIEWKGLIPWDKKPPTHKFPAEGKDEYDSPKSLATNLLSKEILILEDRLINLLQFAEEYRLAGTINSEFPPQVANSVYEKQYERVFVIRAWAYFVIQHWKYFVESETISRIEGGRKFTIWEPEDDLPRLNWNVFSRLWEGCEMRLELESCLQRTGVWPKALEVAFVRETGKGNKWVFRASALSPNQPQAPVQNLRPVQFLTQPQVPVQPQTQPQSVSNQFAAQKPTYQIPMNPQDRLMKKYQDLVRRIRQLKTYLFKYGRLPSITSFPPDYLYNPKDNADQREMKEAGLGTLAKALMAEFVKQRIEIPKEPKNGGSMEPSDTEIEKYRLRVTG